MKPNRDIVAAALGEWDRYRMRQQRRCRRRVFGSIVALVLSSAVLVQLEFGDQQTEPPRASGSVGSVSEVRSVPVEGMAHGLVVAQSRVLGLNRATQRPSRAGLQRVRRSVSSLNHRLRRSRSE